MITTNDGVVKKRGDRVWSIAYSSGVCVPSLFDVHGKGSNNYDAFLEANGCWSNRDNCLKACEEHDVEWGRTKNFSPPLNGKSI